MSYGPGEGTWKCHVCGDERPDAVIGVAKHPIITSRNIQMEVNVRYCTDRTPCALAAQSGKLDMVERMRTL